MLHRLALLCQEPPEHLLATQQEAYRGLQQAHTARLRRKLRDQSSKLKAANAELQMRQNLLNDARSELERARQEREELANWLAQERQKRSEGTLTAESELAGLRKRVTELGESVTRRRQAMAAARRRLTEEQDRLAEARRESQRQGEELAQRESELETLRKSLEISERHREVLEHERQELLETLERLETERQQFLSDLGAWKAEREELQSHLARAEGLQGTLQAEREELQSHLAKAERHRRELEAERDRLLRNLEEAERHQGELEDERGELLTALGEAEAHWQPLQNEVPQLKNRLAEAEQLAETLQRQLASITERHRASSESQSEIDLEDDRSSLQLQARALEDERQRLTTELEAERARLDTELRSVDDLRCVLERERGALTAGETLEQSVLAGERAALQSERERLRTELASLESRGKELESELDRERSKLALEMEALESTRARLASERSELDRERSRLERELEELANERSRLASQQSDLDRERARLESAPNSSLDAEALEQERARLRHDLAESAGLVEERERLKRELEQLSQEREALQRELVSAGATEPAPEFEPPAAVSQTRLQASWDGQYLLAQQGQEAWLEHEGRRVWKRTIPADHRLSWLGNNGEAIFARELGGVVRVLPRADQAPREVEHLGTGQDQSHLGKLRVHVDGRTMCWEKIVPEQRLSDRIFRLLGKKSVAQGSLSHSIGLLDLHTGASQGYVSAVLPRVREERFWWEISPYFVHLVVGLTEQSGFLFRVINITGRALAGEFRVPVKDLAQLWINDEGTVMVDVPGDSSVLDIYRLDRKLQVTPPPRSTVLRLGPHWVAFQTDQTELVVKSFENEEWLRRDLSRLSRPGVQHRVRVTERAQLDLMTLENESLAFERQQLELPSG